VIEKIFNHENNELVALELLNNGLIVEDSFDEITTYKYLCNKDFFNQKQLTMIITPTWKCNFQCPYCCESVAPPIKSVKNYFDVLEKNIEKTFSKYEHIHLSLFGGEPLLFKTQLFKYLSKVKEYCNLNNLTYSTSITTNGSLLNEDVIKELNEHNLKSLQITIDGSKEKHDLTRIFKSGEKSFDLLMNNSKMFLALKREDCNFVLRFNLLNILSNEIRDTLLYLDEDERKNTSLLFRLVYNTSNFKLENSNTFFGLRDFYKLGSELGYSIELNNYKFKPCESGGGVNMFYVLPDLSIWKCINDINYTEGRIGYIDDSGDIELDQVNLINWYKASDFMASESCKGCSKLPDCNGGCILYVIKNKIRQCRDINMISLPHFYNL
jgi:uncharacterized protein